MAPSQLVIIRYIRSVRSAASALSQPRLFVPFVLLSAVEMAALLFYLGFASPLLARFAVPVVAAVFGEGSLHYPAHVFGIPAAVDWIRGAAALLPGVFLLPWAASLTRAVLEVRAEASRAREPRTWGPWAALVVIAIALVVVGLQRGVGFLAEVPLVGRFQPLSLLAVFVARPLLLLLLALILIEHSVGERSGRGAIAAASRLFWDALVTNLLLALSAAVVLAPLHAVISLAPLLVDAGVSGVVASGAVAAVIVDVPVRLMLFAAAASLCKERGRGLP